MKHINQILRSFKQTTRKYEKIIWPITTFKVWKAYNYFFYKHLKNEKEKMYIHQEYV